MRSPDSHRAWALPALLGLLLLPLPDAALALPTTFELEISVGGNPSAIFTDPFGHEYDSEIESIDTYDFQMATDLSEDEASPQAYAGDMSALDFHVSFNSPISAFEALTFTHFDADLGEIEWDYMLSADAMSIWFQSPGASLDFGELFNIELESLHFDCQSVDPFPSDCVELEGFLEASATWTNDPIPEPSAGLSFLVGLLVVGQAIRRQSLR